MSSSGQMRLREVGAVRLVRDGQAEEPGKADGLDPLALRLERAADHLGAHVDAERRLQRGARARRRGAGQRRGEAALMGALGGLLQDRVDDLIRGGLQGAAWPATTACQSVGEIRRMAEERLLPDHADGQQIGDRAVARARELGLPQDPARVLRPAAEIHQQPVKGGLGGIVAEVQTLGGAQDGAVGRVRRAGDMGAEPGQPGNLGRQVMRRPFAPRGKGPEPRRGRPERLPAVEMPRRPEPERARDDGGPVGAGGLGGQIGQRRQRRGRGALGRRSAPSGARDRPA